MGYELNYTVSKMNNSFAVHTFFIYRILMNKLIFCFVLAMGCLGGMQAQSSSEIFLKMKQFKKAGKVLYIAAHPDDENTRLLSYLVNNRNIETAYLSITRGDGGQNLIGTEQGDVLGLIRTHELLQARKIDGAKQYFTRAKDFGFSKSATEVFKLWPDSIVLYDVVKIIRQFQPDIIITRFPDDERAGHGQHEASAMLAKKAFILAADPKAFPDQIEQGLEVWETQRLFWNTFRFGGQNTTSEDQLKIKVGELIPLLGKHDGELAAESRSQHKSQGFGMPSIYENSLEYFTQWAGATASTDLLENISTDWLNDEEEKYWNGVMQDFNFENPRQILGYLLDFKNQLTKVKKFEKYPAKEQLLNEIIIAASGIHVDAYINDPFVFHKDSLNGNIRIISPIENTMMFKLQVNDSLVYKLDTYDTTSLQKSIVKNISQTNFKYKIGEKDFLSNEYWMRNEWNPYYFNVDKKSFVGAPVNPPIFTATVGIIIEGIPIDITVPVVYRTVDPIDGEIHQPIKLLPQLKVGVAQNIILKKEDPIAVWLEPIRNFSYDSLVVEWRSKEAVNYTRLKKGTLKKGQTELVQLKNFSFPKQATKITPYVYVYHNGTVDTISTKLEWKTYKHIPTILWHEKNEINIEPTPIKIAKTNIAYIAGAGDKVAASLSMMGYKVTHLSPAEVNLQTLKQFDAILMGVRALNISTELTDKEAVFMKYIEEGGNLIVQYNTNNQLGRLNSFGPYPYNISRKRVVDENSPIKFELPNHSTLNFPNKLEKSDFEGWVQERGLYFADQFDERYQTPLAFQDFNEPFENGGLIIAKHGKGHFVYTGIAFFRQLPAGVIGAHKLLANIIAL